VPELGDAGRVDAGGFRPAAQALRVVDLLERAYERPGLNLTDAVRQALARSGDRLVLAAGQEPDEGLLAGAAPHLEAQAAGLACRIARSLALADDAAAADEPPLDDLARLSVAREVVRRLGRRWDAAAPPLRRALLVRGLTHLFVASAAKESAERLARWRARAGVATPADFAARRADLPADVVALSARGEELFEDLATFVDRSVLARSGAAREAARARHAVRVVFRALHDDPLLVDDSVLERHARASGVASPRELRAARRDDELARTHRARPEWLRAVADHVASLTDREALDLASALG